MNATCPAWPDGLDPVFGDVWEAIRIFSLNPGEEHPYALTDFTVRFGGEGNGFPIVPGGHQIYWKWRIDIWCFGEGMFRCPGHQVFELMLPNPESSRIILQNFLPIIHECLDVYKITGINVPIHLSFLPFPQREPIKVLTHLGSSNQAYSFSIRIHDTKRHTIL